MWRKTSCTKRTRACGQRCKKTTACGDRHNCCMIFFVKGNMFRCCFIYRPRMKLVQQVPHRLTVHMTSACCWELKSLMLIPSVWARGRRLLFAPIPQDTACNCEDPTWLSLTSTNDEKWFDECRTIGLLDVRARDLESSERISFKDGKGFCNACSKVSNRRVAL